MTYFKDHQEMIYKVLGNSIRIFILPDDSTVKNTTFISHGGVEGTVKIVDISSFPENLSKRDIEKKLEEMGSSSMPVLCIAKYQCQSRDSGDVKLDIVTTSGEIVVSLQRKKRFGILWLADGDKEIPVKFQDGTVASVVRVNKSANAVEIDVAGEDGLYFRRWTPSWQSSTKWMLCAFLCFLPTLGLGGCYGMYKASKADIVTDLTKNHRGNTVDLGTSIFNVIRLDGVSDWKEKLALMILGVYMQVDGLTMPPPVTHNSAVNHF